MSLDDNKNYLTSSPVPRALVTLMVPYLASLFLQSALTLTDTFVISRFCPTKSVAAVTVAGQVIHFFTTMAAALTTGVTVLTGGAVGGKASGLLPSIAKSALAFFLPLGALLSVAALLALDPIVSLLAVPKDAILDAKLYLAINLGAGVLIMAINALSALFRGAGDNRTPLFAIGAGAALNVALDFLLVGLMKKGVLGAALGTVAGNILCVAILTFCALPKLHGGAVSARVIKKALFIGVPVALQDALIQISFLVITRIANSLGLEVSAAVGVTERIIGFLFLVNSATLQAVCVATSQNRSAGLLARAKLSLCWGLMFGVSFGAAMAGACFFCSKGIIGFFTSDERVIALGGSYLKSYGFDCALAAVHFAFSGFFTGSERSGYSFVHNAVSVIFVRIPLAALAAKNFSGSLFLMGLAAPAGSAVSAIICVVFYFISFLKEKE